MASLGASFNLDLRSVVPNAERGSANDPSSKTTTPPRPSGAAAAGSNNNQNNTSSASKVADNNTASSSSTPSSVAGAGAAGNPSMSSPTSSSVAGPSVTSTSTTSNVPPPPGGSSHVRVPRSARGVISVNSSNSHTPQTRTPATLATNSSTSNLQQSFQQQQQHALGGINDAQQDPVNVVVRLKPPTKKNASAKDYVQYNIDLVSRVSPRKPSSRMHSARNMPLSGRRAPGSSRRATGGAIGAGGAIDSESVGSPNGSTTVSMSSFTSPRPQINAVRGPSPCNSPYGQPAAASGPSGSSAPCVSAATQLSLTGPSHDASGADEQRTYEFARVLDPNVTDAQMCESLVPSVVDQLKIGYNACVLCYGQTGSGKTHTINAITDSLIDSIYDFIDLANDVVEISYIQIYNNNVYSLLSGASSGTLSTTFSGSSAVVGVNNNGGVASQQPGANGELGVLLPKPKGSMVSEPLFIVKDRPDLRAKLAVAQKRRCTAPHSLNPRSSRSHTLLSIRVTRCLDGIPIMVSKVTLADLAGSERVKRTGVAGGGLEEAIAINRSLSVLHAVIKALATDTSVLPFRESVLTLYLAPTLINCFTTVIATASLERSNFAETKSTLEFANTAKRCIITKTKTRTMDRGNAASRDSVHEQLVKEIETLRNRVEVLQREADIDRQRFKMLETRAADEHAAADAVNASAMEASGAANATKVAFYLPAALAPLPAAQINAGAASPLPSPASLSPSDKVAAYHPSRSKLLEAEGATPTTAAAAAAAVSATGASAGSASVPIITASLVVTDGTGDVVVRRKAASATAVGEDGGTLSHPSSSVNVAAAALGASETLKNADAQHSDGPVADTNQLLRERIASVESRCEDLQRMLREREEELAALPAARVAGGQDAAQLQTGSAAPVAGSELREPSEQPGVLAPSTSEESEALSNTAANEEFMWLKEQYNAVCEEKRVIQKALDGLRHDHRIATQDLLTSRQQLVEWETAYYALRKDFSDLRAEYSELERKADAAEHRLLQERVDWAAREETIVMCAASSAMEAERDKLDEALEEQYALTEELQRRLSRTEVERDRLEALRTDLLDKVESKDKVFRMVWGMLTPQQKSQFMTSNYHAASPAIPNSSNSVTLQVGHENVKLRAELNSLNKKLDEERSKVKERENRIEDLQTTNSLLASQLHNREDEYESLLRLDEQEKLKQEQMEQEMCDLYSYIEAYAQRQQEFDEQMQEAQMEWEALNEEYNRAQSEIATLQDRLSSALQELKYYEDNAGVLTARLREAEEEKTSLAREREDNLARVAELEQQLVTEQVRSSNVSRRMKMADTKRRILASEIQTHNTHGDVLRRRLTQIDATSVQGKLDAISKLDTSKITGHDGSAGAATKASVAERRRNVAERILRENRLVQHRYEVSQIARRVASHSVTSNANESVDREAPTRGGSQIASVPDHLTGSNLTGGRAIHSSPTRRRLNSPIHRRSSLGTRHSNNESHASFSSTSNAVRPTRPPFSHTIAKTRSATATRVSVDSARTGKASSVPSKALVPRRGASVAAASSSSVPRGGSGSTERLSTSQRNTATGSLGRTPVANGGGRAARRSSTESVSSPAGTGEEEKRSARRKPVTTPPANAGVHPEIPRLHFGKMSTLYGSPFSGGNKR